MKTRYKWLLVCLVTSAGSWIAGYLMGNGLANTADRDTPGHGQHHIKASARGTLVATESESGNGVAASISRPVEMWGEANAQGVQVNLEAKKRTWKSNEIPELTVRMRNKGEARVFYLGVVAVECLVEFDGHWFGWVGPVSIGTDEKSLSSGEEAILPEVLKLVNDWARTADGGKPKIGLYALGGNWGEELKLTPGRHTVRVAWKGEVREALNGGGSGDEAISNPVEIEVTAHAPL